MLTTILIIEDDKDLSAYLNQLLLDNRFNILKAGTGSQALATIKKTPPDLVILDLGLPDIDGETLCTEIQNNYPEIPIIILTAKGTTKDIVHGLALGAVDYMTKPFAGDELIARIKTRLKTNNAANHILKAADLEMNNETFEIKRNGKLIHLTQTEFNLLQYLLINKGRVLTREMILNKVWSYSPDTDSRLVDVYIGYLRKKIDAGFKKKLIISTRGFGYSVKD